MVVSGVGATLSGVTWNRLLWLLERPGRLLASLLVGAVLVLSGWYGLRRGLLVDAWFGMWEQLGDAVRPDRA